jgi:hypothetical protein
LYCRETRTTEGPEKKNCSGGAIFDDGQRAKVLPAMATEAQQNLCARAGNFCKKFQSLCWHQYKKATLAVAFFVLINSKKNRTHDTLG